VALTPRRIGRSRGALADQDEFGVVAKLLAPAPMGPARLPDRAGSTPLLLIISSLCVGLAGKAVSIH
jgi:hypothetical protein